MNTEDYLKAIQEAQDRIASEEIAPLDLKVLWEDISSLDFAIRLNKEKKICNNLYMNIKKALDNAKYKYHTEIEKTTTTLYVLFECGPDHEDYFPMKAFLDEGVAKEEEIELNKKLEPVGMWACLYEVGLDETKSDTFIDSNPLLKARLQHEPVTSSEEKSDVEREDYFRSMCKLMSDTEEQEKKRLAQIQKKTPPEM